MAHYLVTGVAGFIASRVAEILLEAGHRVVGVDNLNAAYDVRMKEYRLEKLQSRPGFKFLRLDISDRDAVNQLLPGYEIQPAVIGGVAGFHHRSLFAKFLLQIQ